MKGNIFGTFLCATALCAALLLFGCDKTEETRTIETTVYGPTFTFSSSSVNAGQAGGDYSLTYTVANAASDGSIYCSADNSWISGIDASIGGVISFTVAANNSYSARSGNITINYSYTLDGVSKGVHEVVGVIQYGISTPEIVVDPKAKSADYDAGTCSFAYSISNPAEDGELGASASVGWITGFDFSAYGTVTASLAANDGASLRYGTVTLTYTYSEGEVTKDIVIIQDHEGDENDYDIPDIYGTYIATGLVIDRNTGSSVVTDYWQLKVYQTDSSDGYDFYIDGLVPTNSGMYAQYGDHRVSAGGYFLRSKLLIPAQVCPATRTYSGTTYYLAYEVVRSYAGGSGFLTDKSGELISFSYDPASGTWVSEEYGAMFAGCTSATDPYTVKVYFDATCPGVTLTKQSSTTGAPSGRETAAGSGPDGWTGIAWPVMQAE